MTWVHELKTLPQYFQAIWEGRKTFELRCTDDRQFYEGSVLILREYDPVNGYTGRRMACKVGFILFGGEFELPENYCIMSLLRISKIESVDGPN
jgi:hypothetical protein